MKHFDVPFISNPNTRCVPATIGMILAYFMPENYFTMSELEKICGYVEGKGTWQTQPILSLSQMGFETVWIEDFDHKSFIEDTKKYLRSLLDDESYEWQLKHTDLELEAKRMREYMEAGNEIQRRIGTPEDIKHFIDDGWLVWLELNGLTLHGKPGYDGHAVLVIGYDDKNVMLNNADSISGDLPKQIVSWETLQKARKEFGGSYSIYAFRKTKK